MLAVWFDSNTVKMTTAEHDLTKFSEHAFSIFIVLNAVINAVIHYPNNLTGLIFFEDVTLFNFEEDNLNVDNVYQVDIYNSRFANHFVRHQGMISIRFQTTRFGLRTGLFMLLT